MNFISQDESASKLIQVVAAHGSLQLWDWGVHFQLEAWLCSQSLPTFLFRTSSWSLVCFEYFLPLHLSTSSQRKLSAHVIDGEYLFPMVAMIINYQKQWPTSIGIYSLTVLEIRCLTRIYLPGLKSRCCPDWFLLEAVRGENLFPCLYHLLEVSYTLWLVAPSFILRSITSVSASVLVHLLLQFWRLPLSRTTVMTGGPPGSSRNPISRFLPVDSCP